jgi:Spy/CpxP family protein refolding chaperone
VTKRKENPMFRSLTAMTLLIAAFTAGAGADTPPAHDPVAEALIPPEVVMQNQQALGLTDAQRNAIQTAVEAAQQRFTHLQFTLAGDTEKLVDLLRADHIDRDRALSALDTELTVEREVKEAQLGLMIAIKNVLTADQIARARRLEGGAKP